MSLVFEDWFWFMHIHICQYGEISVSCTIHCGSLSPPSRACSFISFVLVFRIHLYDKLFHFYHFLTYIYYSSMNHQFLFCIICSYGIISCCYYWKFSFSLKVSPIVATSGLLYVQ